MLEHERDELKRSVIEELASQGSDSLLDVSCADGRAARAFKELSGGTVTGIEAVPKLARAARTQLDCVLPRRVEDVDAAEFLPAAFGFILCTQALGQSTEPLQVLRKYRRWLKPEGQLIVAFANSRNHRRISSAIHGNGYHGVAKSGLSRLQFEQLAYRTGFAVESWQMIPGAGYTEWAQQGQATSLEFPSFQVDMGSVQDAEELFADAFVAKLRPVRLREFGLTSVVLQVSFGSLENVRECVERVLQYTDEPIELLPVLRREDHRITSYLESIPAVENVFFSEPSVASGEAEWIGACDGEQVLLLSDHCRVSTGWLRGLLEGLLDDPGNAGVGPVLSADAAPRTNGPLGDREAELESAAWQLRSNRRLSHADWLDPSCVLFRTEAFASSELWPQAARGSAEAYSQLLKRTRDAGARLLVAGHVYVRLCCPGETFARVARSRVQKCESPEDGLATPETESDGKPCLNMAAETGEAPFAESRSRLSLCMIVRDNEDTIEDALASVRPWVDEIVVVDTGSLDRTPDICRRYDAKMYQFPWCDDFSAARNVSLDHATGDWLFWMDSDDVMPPEQGQRLRELIDGRHAEECFGYVMKVHCLSSSAGQRTVVDHVKVFRNLPQLRFEHRIHEQILPAIRRAGGTVSFTDIFVEHQGSRQSPEKRAAKLERDFRILELDLLDHPDHPFVLFNLGMTCEDAGKHEEAIEHLQRSIEVSGPNESHVAKAWALLASSLTALQRPEDALSACDEALKAFPSDPELLFRRAVLLQGNGRHADAEADYRKVLSYRADERFRSFDPSVCGGKAHHNLGLLLQEQGRVTEAASHLQQAIAELQSFGPSWLALGRCLARLGRRDDLRMLVDEAAGRTIDPPATIALLQAIAGEADGETDGAEHALMSAWDEFRDPDCLDELARILGEAGKTERMREVLALLNYAYPDNASTLLNLGSLTFQQGDCEAGIALVRRALDLRPDARQIQSRLQEMLELERQPS